MPPHRRGGCPCRLCKVYRADLTGAGNPSYRFKRDVTAFLKRCTESYDLVFADPPYDFSQEELSEIVSLCFKRDLVKEDGILIVEHSTKRDLGELEHFDSARKYGSTVFSFFRP